jgi:phage shock protein A
MDKQPRIPDTETSKRLLTNLRRTRLEMEEFNLQLDQIIARFEQELSQQKLQRVRRSLANLEIVNN